jgi:ABC-2 type transport system ATP-binding protein
LSYCVETYNLTKRFPRIKGYSDLLLHPFRKKETTVLSNINLRIKKGELFGLLGPNGAGKTTLIKILCNLIIPTSGKAFVNGFEVTKEGKKLRKTIGYVVDDERSFYWRLTGRQNLMFFATLNNIPKREAEARISRLLKFEGLEPHADRMFKEYSTGMKKMLALARGLITNPEIVFMDEPTSGLDPGSAQKLKNHIRKRLVEIEKRTVVFATHNLREAEELCSRIAVMDKGEIRFSSTVEEIKTKFNSPRRYMVGLNAPQEEFLEKIRLMPMVKRIMPGASNSLSTQYELEIISDNGAVLRIIEEIIGMGGKISSFYEKQASLEEVFPSILEWEESEPKTWA